MRPSGLGAAGMPISIYPRPGHPIAPSLLGPLLEQKAPFGSGTLRELDQSAWVKFSDEKCRILGNCVVEHLARQLGHLKEQFGSYPVCHLNIYLLLNELELGTRTYNCLNQIAIDKRPGGIAELTIRDALDLSGFGVKSLVDLLTSIEGAVLSKHADNELRHPQNTCVQSSSQNARWPISFTLDEILEQIDSLPGISLVDQRDPRLGKLLYRLCPYATTVGELKDHREWLITKHHANNLLEFFNVASDLVDELNDAFNRVDELLEQISSLPNISHVVQSDPRLGELLFKLCPHAAKVGDLNNHREWLVVKCSPDEIREFFNAASDCLNLTIENELLAIVKRQSMSMRNKKLVADYFGFGGKQLLSLEALGKKYKITRERVRQLCVPTRVKRLTVAPFAPSLDSALSYIDQHNPEKRVRLDADLLRLGVIEAGTTIHSILRVAQFLGRKADFEIIGLSRKEWVLRKDDMQHVSRLEQAARRTIRQSGAAQIDDIVVRSRVPLARKKAVQIATVLLSTMVGFRWLDRANGWFCVDDSHPDQLRRRIRKVLAVCGEIDVGQLRAAIRRDYRMRGLMPPKSVVLEICRQMPGVSVDGDQVLSTQRDNPMDLVQGDEGVLIGLLQTHGRVCRREELFELAARVGVSRPSFWRCLMFCPTISRYAPNIYGLTGESLPPGVIEEMIGDRKVRPVVQDHGWTPENTIWIAYRLSEATIGSGVVGVPSAKREMLQGRFTLIDSHSDAKVGNLVVKQSSAWGLTPFFRRRGAEEGDYLLLEFNTFERVVAISIGDESLVECLES